MIRVDECEKSRFYASIALPTWIKHGLTNIAVTRASTPETIRHRRDLTFATCRTAKYARLAITKQFTATERAVWYSHFDLWRKIGATVETAVVAEHDAVVEQYPHTSADITFLDHSSMGAYAITPEVARYLVEQCSERQIDCGPYAMVEYVMREHSTLTISNHITSDFRPCVRQVYSRKVGASVDHYDTIDDAMLRERLSEASRSNPSLLHLD